MVAQATRRVGLRGGGVLAVYSHGVSNPSFDRDGRRAAPGPTEDPRWTSTFRWRRAATTAARAGPDSATDPVCGMTVDIVSATARDLVAEHDGTTYYFCGKGCKLEFGDDPGRYLDPAYVPSM